MANDFSESKNEHTFTIDEVLALARFLENEWVTHDDDEIVKVLGKIFLIAAEYKRKNGMVG